MASVTTDLPVAILAGGLATRLHPLTEKIPKLLVEVAGEPFFSHQLRLLRQAGLNRVVACVGHLGDQIVAHYGDGSRWRVQLDYSFDGEKPLGTGGALIHALPKLGEAFFVMYGDSYLPVDYAAVGRAFGASGQPALMTVFANHGRYDASNVWLDHGRIRSYDKRNRTPQMQHIDYGLGVLTPSALADWPRDTPLDLADIYHRLAVSGQLAAYEASERFYEIGSSSGLNELDQLLRKRSAAS
ncbi:MAG: nucleotidyltransferase family protein [Opitutales bacterium]